MDPLGFNWELLGDVFLGLAAGLTSSVRVRMFRTHSGSVTTRKGLGVQGKV